MSYGIIQTSIISLILIFLVHYLFTFFKDNLTVPKVIDLVEHPKEQYENLLCNTKNKTDSCSAPLASAPLASAPLASAPLASAPLASASTSVMKDELKKYLKELKQKSNEPSYANESVLYTPY